MSKRIRKRFTSEEKLAILRLHLLEGTPVSDLCDKHGIGPSIFYRWQKDFFENRAVALEHRTRSQETTRIANRALGTEAPAQA